MPNRQPIQRHPTSNIVRTKIIILGDGETEEDYFNRVSELKIFPRLHLRFEKGNEENFLIKKKEHAGNPYLMLILDIDDAKSGTKRFTKIANILSNSKNSKYVYFSNYSFESWLLNHKMYFAQPISEKCQYNDSIKNCFSVEKWCENKNVENRSKIMNQIDATDINNACKNLKRINQKIFSNNPSSNMDELIESLQKIK